MTDFTGKLISDTYKQLLKVAVSTNTGLDTTVRTIESGDGQDSALQLSDDKLNVNGTFQLLGVDVTVNANQINLAGHGIFANVSSSSGTFSANVCASAFYGDGSNITGVVASAETATNVSGGYAVLTSAQISSNMSVTDFVAATGSFTTKVSGVAAEFSGTVSAGFFTGDGSNLTNVSATPATSVSAFTVNTLGVVSTASVTDITAVTGGFSTKVSATALEISGVVSGASAVFSGTVSAATFAGDIDGASGSFSTGISATAIEGSTGGFTTKVSTVALEISGAVSGASAVFSGTVSAATFDGALTGDVTGDIDGASGSFSTGISTTDFVAGTGSFTTKVSGVAGEFSGTVSAAYFTGDGSNLTNLPSASTSVAAFTANQLTVVTVASIASLNVDTNILLKAQGDLRFGDSDSSNYVAFQGDGTIASNITWTLPNADGDANQSLTTDGLGALSWATGGGGYYKGDNGIVGSSAGDIFRINEQALDANVTITSTENASATGPLSVSSSYTLTVEGTLVII